MQSPTGVPMQFRLMSRHPPPRPTRLLVFQVDLDGRERGVGAQHPHVMHIRRFYKKEVAQQRLPGLTDVLGTPFPETFPDWASQCSTWRKGPLPLPGFIRIPTKPATKQPGKSGSLRVSPIWQTIRDPRVEPAALTHTPGSVRGVGISTFLPRLGSAVAGLFSLLHFCFGVADTALFQACAHLIDKGALSC